MTKGTVKVVVCGDDKVGKTSLIVTLMKDRFVPNLQDVLPPVTINRDFSSNPYSPKGTILIDTNNEDIIQLHLQLKSADVIWLVYSDHESYEKISLYWMMLFRSLGLNIPVILCKNKCDRYNNTYNMENQLNVNVDTKVEDEEFIPILMEFKEVDTCIKVSALTKYNINQVFYLCQRSITYPIVPLFDARVGQLKPLAREALERIFLLSDNDQDNYLNDEEMLALQKKCFNKSIDINELEFIKDTLLDLRSSSTPYQNPYYVEGKGITKEGFLMLNKIYAEKGRHETIWGMLREFRYTDSLSLDDTILHPKLNIPDTSSVELSPKGYRFLVDLFLKYDKDNDGGLNDEELISMFQCTPGLPKLWSQTDFPLSSVVNNRGSITLQGWLAQWSMTTFLDYSITTEYLIWFGYEGDTRLALQITKARRFRRRAGKFYRTKVTDRKVFNCLVIGKQKCGKTSLLDSFLGRIYSTLYTPTTKPRIAVNSLELKGGKQYYLILQEFNEFNETDILRDKRKLKECDVLCLTYDSSDPESFSYIIDLFKKYNKYIKSIPIVFVALKADLDKQQQRCSFQPDDFAEQLYLDHPLHVSSLWLSSLNELFIKITETALKPEECTAGFPEEMNIDDSDYMQTAVVLGSSIGFVTLLAFTLVKLFKANDHK
ncbi:similar to Saccharomyces cerevisiae YAL048C GEM1 Evolutionarily-conserved tail-anchored outer mitochondrial membrane GTPase which regulates mitochondrial morphology [Maudiozyma saulgeensis]|uniref:Mitochondrial Rho GTPase n=1 Tax=Maudiozyma saulgeensis TaxID=1789683 RepID=A0A1X7QZV5_9SACH|nr:similar to Saccharomyces cerevisiae YAL048C GEM1 Evolutionarily-conserved tail-anchored outer mitochondrial membrane GTPase which regulates mitochondrial morphology [Kazachstania saulgeensis]